MVNFDICQFLATPGPFEYFGQNQGSSESQCFLDEGATGRQSGLMVVGGQVPRLYGGTIFGGVQHPRASGRALSPKVQKMSNCQKDVKCQKIKHIDYGGGSQKQIN